MHPFKYYYTSECLVLNFGSQHKIRGLAMLSMEIDSNFNSERLANIHGNEAADNCFLVFIGGKYVQILNQVMETVETMSKKIGLQPLGLYITMENNYHNFKFTDYADGAKFPLVILIKYLTFMLSQFIIFSKNFTKYPFYFLDI